MAVLIVFIHLLYSHISKRTNSLAWFFVPLILKGLECAGFRLLKYVKPLFYTFKALLLIVSVVGLFCVVRLLLYVYLYLCISKYENWVSSSPIPWEYLTFS